MKPVNPVMLKPAFSYVAYKVFPTIGLSLILLLLSYILSLAFIVGSLLTCAHALYRIFYVRSYRYMITERYILMTKGIWFKTSFQVELHRIKDYCLTQSAWYKIFGVMNLTLKTTDPEEPRLSIDGIPFSDLLDELRERIQTARIRNDIV